MTIDFFALSVRAGGIHRISSPVQLTGYIITINEKKTEKEKEYSILLADTTMSILKKLYPECEIAQLKDITLSSAWTTFMSKGKQPSAPEDYIEVER